MNRIFRGRGCAGGTCVAEAIVALEPFGFWQGIDPQTGTIINRRHSLFGHTLKDKAFVFTFGRGSTGNPGIFLEAVRNGVAPAAMINVRAEPMITLCSILAEQFYDREIPVVDQLSDEFYQTVQTGDLLRVDGSEGTVEILP